MGAKSNELKIIRIYDAPVKMVWEAWTDNDKVAKWWGPRGFSITTHAKDLRVGGFWKYTMHGPDGTNWENRTIYHEVEKYSRLVYDHGGNEDRPPLFRVTVNFKEVKGKTHMDMTMAFDTAETAKQSKKFIKEAGGNGTWDRLAEFLEKEDSGKEKFVINRTFEAPLDMVFDAWSQPERFAQWLGPKGMSMEFIRADVKPGGSSFYKMTNGSDLTMYGKIQYKEVTRPSKIVYTQQFSDEKESVSRHPFAPVWPETMLTTVLFNEEGPKETRVTVIWEIVGDATAAEVAAFVKERGGMTQGWTGSFDKLDELFAKLNG